MEKHKFVLRVCVCTSSLQQFFFLCIPEHRKMNGTPTVTAEGGMFPCGWCSQAEKPNLYVLPLKNGRHTFCSAVCLSEFRKRACFQCGEAISGAPFQSLISLTTRDFCSEKCCLKFKKRDLSKLKLNCSSLRNLQSNPDVPHLPTSVNLESSALLGSNLCLFAWEDYLTETRSIAAPQVCFKQVC